MVLNVYVWKKKIHNQKIILQALTTKQEHGKTLSNWEFLVCFFLLLFQFSCDGF